LCSRHGDKLFQDGKIHAAKAKYLQEAKTTVGANFCLPSPPGEGDGGVLCPLYIKMHPLQITNLMGCCLGMARCLVHEKQTELALAWLEEINSLQRCTYFTLENPMYDWMDNNIPGIPEMKTIRAHALCLASDIFLSLGNTGTGTIRRHAASTILQPLDEELKRIVDFSRLVVLYQTRHPDPQRTSTTADPSSALQVRGSWTKLPVAKPGGFKDGREDFTCFIWNSHFYVAGGRRAALGPWYRDFWVLNLNPRGAWRQLPDYPRSVSESGMFTGWSMLVHNNTALLFTGRPTVDVFDLVTESWTSFRTTYVPNAADIEAGVKDGWPYPRQLLSDATMQIAHNKLYVFGGSHATTAIGCNLWMELDLATRKWRRLTGYVRAPQYADYSCPGPRRSASSWVSTDKVRIFLLFGQANRDGASFHNEPHESTEAFGYEDMWSWSIKDERWRRERMSGNPPCARTEMACTYNEKLQKVVVFGGYQPNLPTRVVEQRDILFHYSYFADTFLYDMTPSNPTDPEEKRTLKAPKWKQVLTFGFPTYRCQAQLAYDRDTGRMYVFGGFTNNQYIPTRPNLLSRSFADLFELRIDEPGGHFEEVNVEEEVRSAKAGPWQRCFSCAAAGPWRKCGGTCKGRVFFCGGTCLKEGWKEHKEMHNCRK
ncbi:hypothetical protein C8R47DRAFT_1276978, partial [Mycena vitilis]